MLPQSHDAAAAATPSEDMSAASRPLDNHPNIDAAPAEEKPTEKTNTAARARLDELPSELTTIIADHLDTKSLKMLRLSCKRLAEASSYTFGHRVPTSLTFFFLRSSMQRLALLTENSRWNEHFDTLEILSSSPEPHFSAPCWTTDSRHMRSYGQQLRSTYSNPAARATPPRFGFGGTMPNVHTLSLCLQRNYDKDTPQHLHLPRLYAALPNLTTLHLTHAQTCLIHNLARYVPPPGACRRLRHLRITHSDIRMRQELLTVLRTHRATLQTVEVSDSKIDSLEAVQDYLKAEEVLLPLREVVLEEVSDRGWEQVHRWRWDGMRVEVSEKDVARRNWLICEIEGAGEPFWYA